MHMAIEDPGQPATGGEIAPGPKAGGPNVCPDCGGTGRIGAEVCVACGGTGRLQEPVAEG